MVVEVIRTSNELMSDVLPTDSVINEFKDILIKLEKVKDIEEGNILIERFYDKIKNWSIIIIDNNSTFVWVQLPMKYYKGDRKLNFKERLRILYEEYEWVPPVVTTRGANVVSNITFPMEVKLSKCDYEVAINSDESKFYYTVFNLIVNIIEIMVHYKSKNVAIYKSPAGVVAMNRMKRWIDEVSKDANVDTEVLTSSLNVKSFSELIEQSTLTLDNENSVVNKAQRMLGFKVDRSHP